MSMKTQFLYEFIPVPFGLNNKTGFLNMTKSTFLLKKNSKYVEISDKLLSDCKHFEEITLCESWMLKYLEDPEDCINNAIKTLEHNKCSVGQIKHKQQPVKTGENQIYFYVLKPIQIRIDCRNKNITIDVNFSREITYSDECKMFQSTSKIRYNRTDNSVIRIDTPFVSPNLAYFDPIISNWTKINNLYEIRDFLKNERVESIIDLDKTNVKMQENAKTNEPKGIFGEILNFYTNAFSGPLYFFYSLCVTILILLFLKYFMILFKICKKLFN